MDMGITVGVLGATSPVGEQVLNQLIQRKVRVVAFSRSCVDNSSDNDNVRWVNLRSLNPVQLQEEVGGIHIWIAACSIWVTPEHFILMKCLSVRRVVCVSSTSQFTKINSASPYEEQIVEKLIDGERALRQWAEQESIGWTVLRPTLIYGRGNDRNLSEIVKMIRKFRVFPLFGQANGMRQPVYVDDVACACVQAAFSDSAINKAYNISGAETLTYRQMISRVFEAMGLRPRLIHIDLKLFNCALFFLKMVPRYRNWNADMVLRMNRDMVFDHGEAKRDFSFDPQGFVLRDVDVQI